MHILALADDMTGALEVGAVFAAAGMSSQVAAKPVPADTSPVVVFDTETRHGSPEFACREVRRFVLESGGLPPRLVYKKTDSTLRGNISAELRALADLFPAWRIGYAPAYPALGRTVKDGVLYVDGVPVAETAFAHDALNPIRGSSLSALLDPSLPCTIFDGATDADLVTAAQTILSDESMRIAAGPAGLAHAIAEQIVAQRSDPSALPRVRTCLVMNGSVHPQSALQVRYAKSQGCFSRDSGAAWRALHQDFPSGISPSVAASRNGQYVLEQLAIDAPDAILIIGGDTAFAVVAALGLPTISPICELVPGVPVSRIEAAQLAKILPNRKRDLILITKAGGFGAENALCRARELLTA